MKFTVRYAHLDSIGVKLGQMLNEGDQIGLMGNTGQSFGAHLHIDCVRGRQTKKYTLAEIEAGHYISEPRQLNFFVDDELFFSKTRITTYYCDPTYHNNGKLHLGYDLAPSTGDFRIKWNRSKVGEVCGILENDAGYGNCVMICFEG